MKKLIVLIITLALILSMAVTAYAVTPTMQVPDVPQISNIKIEVKLDERVYENAVQEWFAEHPIKFDWSAIYRRINYEEE